MPDRALDTSRSWLTQHQSISIVARDRAGGYGEAIAKALPDAEQVANRLHLMENSSRALLAAVGRSMRQIRQAIGSNFVDPKLLIYAEKLRYEGYRRCQETSEAIRDLSKKGTPIWQIVRQTGHSRKLVRDVLRGQRLEFFRTRPSSLNCWQPRDAIGDFQSMIRLKAARRLMSGLKQEGVTCLAASEPARIVSVRPEA